jgi:bifunctional protein TilS/HprT
VPWYYEPRSFPIAWDDHGTPSKYFTPDFYLPDDDLYIEITTMSQKLVTKKNGKLRRLKELYPEINCKLFYQRDYLNLVVKYGLEGPENMEEPPAPTRMPGRPAVVRLEERGERLTG